MGERELAEDTGLARSAYMSSESALRAELLPEEAEETEDTLLTLRDLDGDGVGGGGGDGQPQDGRKQQSGRSKARGRWSLLRCT